MWEKVFQLPQANVMKCCTKRTLYCSSPSVSPGTMMDRNLSQCVWKSATCLLASTSADMASTLSHVSLILKRPQHSLLTCSPALSHKHAHTAKIILTLLVSRPHKHSQTHTHTQMSDRDLNRHRCLVNWKSVRSIFPQRAINESQ